MSNTPELVYLLGAISMIGAKANIFNEEFDPEYITEIIDGCNANIMFVEDGKYEKAFGKSNCCHIYSLLLCKLQSLCPQSRLPS